MIDGGCRHTDEGDQWRNRRVRQVGGQIKSDRQRASDSQEPEQEEQAMFLVARRIKCA